MLPRSDLHIGLTGVAPGRPAPAARPDLDHGHRALHLALPAEDQEAVRRLILDGLAERWSGQLDESPNPDLADLASAHPHGRIVVGRLDAEIVATGIVKPAGPGLAEIVRMSVAAGHRRSGHGRQILQALLAAAREGSASRVVLETCDSWEGVVSFYLAAEFSINHYRDSPWCRDAYFVLDLPPG